MSITSYNLFLYTGLFDKKVTFLNIDTQQNIVGFVQKIEQNLNGNIEFTLHNFEKVDLFNHKLVSIEVI